MVQKEDIQKVFKLNEFEKGILTYFIDNENNTYIEKAWISVDQSFNQIHNSLEKWIKSVPRLSDVFIYEQVQEPLRVRLKNVKLEINTLDNTDNQSIENFIQHLNFDINIQKPGLLKLFWLSCFDKNYLIFIYPHILFDGDSFYLALNNFKNILENREIIELKDVNISENLNSKPIEKKPFFITEYLNSPKQTGFKVFSNFTNLNAIQIQQKWLSFLFQFVEHEQICIGEVFSNRDKIDPYACGYFLKTNPVFFSKSRISENEIQESRMQSMEWGRVQEPYFDHIWVIEPYDKVENAGFFTQPHYVLSIIIKPEQEIQLVWNLNKVHELQAEAISESFFKYLDGKIDSYIIENQVKITNSNVVNKWKEILHKNLDFQISDSYGHHFTYHEIEKISNQVACYLKYQKIKKSDHIGLSISNSAYLPAIILGILKVGAVYVPLDLKNPLERLKFIEEDSNLKYVIVDRIENIFKNEINLDLILQNNQYLCNSEELHSNDIAYIIYTSGTTGRPKGCLVTHGNLLNLVENQLNKFPIKQNQHWILAHNYSFDFSIWEIFMPLLNGFSLFIPQRTDIEDTSKFVKLLEDKKIHVLNQTPQAFYNLIDSDEIEQTDLSHIQWIVFGGDRLDLQKLQKWQKKYPNCKLFNLYGITETTVHVSSFPIDNKNPELSTIGKALEGYEMCGFNQNFEVPAGFQAELWISGSGVCAGYWKQENLTNDKFIFKNDKKWYKSGDLAWKMANGDWVYLGRNDKQVKIRGFRMELAEIEKVIFDKTQFQNIVLFIENKFLVAFCEKNQNIWTEELIKNSISDFLPKYALPTFYVFIDKIPLNFNGKVSENELIEHFKTSFTTIEQSSDFLSKKIEEILKMPIDSKKSFIGNGGDSISAIRVSNVLKSQHLKINIQDLLSNNSIAQIQYTEIDKINHDENVLHTKLKEDLKLGESIKNAFYLTDYQKGMLWECLKNPNDSVYVEQMVWELDGNVNDIKIALEKALKSTPSLLFSLYEFEKSHFWILYKNYNFDNYISIHEEYSEELLENLRNNCKVSNNKLLNFTFIPGEKVKIIWTHHHLLLDGWSLNLFLKKWMNYYKNVENSVHEELDYLIYLQNYKNDNTKITTVVLPEKNDIPDWNPEMKEGISEFIISTENIRQNVKNIAKSLEITEANVCLGMWLYFHVYYTSEKFPSVQTVFNQRNENQYDSIGLFIKTNEFFVENENESFFDFLKKVHKQYHEDLRNTKNYIGNLSQTLFVFENYPIDNQIIENIDLKRIYLYEQTHYKLNILFYPKENAYNIRMIYDQKSFNDFYIHNLFTRFNEFITKILNNPNETIKWQENSLIFGKQQNIQAKQILDIINFESEHICLHYKNEKSYTYREIKNLANNLANKLIINGIKAQDVIFVDVEETLEFTISMIAIYLNHAVFCPVDSRYPMDRKLFILKNANAKLIISNHLYESEVKQINLNEIKQDTFDYEELNSKDEVSFILHTSGSTGLPKGVVQTHDCLVHLIEWTKSRFKIDSSFQILQLSSFGFDASIHEVLLALSAQAQILSMNLQSKTDLFEIRNKISEFSKVMAWIPSRLLNSILEIDLDFFKNSNIHSIVCTGEAMIFSKYLKHLQKTGIRLINFYGPTETHVITGTDEPKYEKASIGEAVDHVILDVCNPVGESFAKGMIGELWVAGPYLAKEYLNDPILNQEKFVNKNSRRWFKTGDWVLVDPNNQFHYLKRMDHQIKIRGFRVEPSEIEIVANNIGEVNQSIVLIHQENIILFFTGIASIETIENELVAKLPYFMIPDKFIHLENIPLNINGKTDRTKLLEYIIYEKNELPEHSIAVQLWSEVLQHTDFQYHSKFKSVGGHSIALMRLQTLIYKKTNISIPVHVLIKLDSCALLDHYLLENQDNNYEFFPETYKLNTVQKQILAQELLYPNNNSPFKHFAKISSKSKISPNIYAKIIKKYPNLAAKIVNSNNEYFWSLKAQESEINKLFDLQITEYDIIIHWHHVLLDGHGLMLLLDVFEDLNKVEIENIKPISFHLIKNQTIENHNVKIETKPAIILEEIINIENIPSFEQVLALIQMLQILDSGQDQSIVSYTESIHSQAVPFMNTSLRNSKRIFSENILTWNDWMKNEEICSDESCWVLNYFSKIENDNFRILELSKPKYTKYPIEWQFILMNNEILLQLIIPENEISRAKTLFEKFKNLLFHFKNDDFELKELFNANISTNDLKNDLDFDDF